MTETDHAILLSNIADTTTNVYSTALSGDLIALDEHTIARIEKCRAYLEQSIQKNGAIHYGINTGFGALCDTIVPQDRLEELQLNIIRSHACGTGGEVPAPIVRIMLLLKVIGLGKGYSGVRGVVVQGLLDMLNADILPIVYQQGSLGASGDLAPLAHLSLPLIGEGYVRMHGDQLPSQKAMAKSELTPIALQSKEGLALLNGTQFMTAYGTYLVEDGKKLAWGANMVAALACELYLARPEAFAAPIQRIRPHAGQARVAAEVMQWREGSPTQDQSSSRVQDPYSFRCIPQVHGASLDVLAHVEGVFNTEIASVTDNPSIFPDEDLILSGGNFHGQPLAMALDYLAIALAELGSISERRCYQLLAGGMLPAFLAQDPGLHSGMMIPQYTAAGIVSQNKQLCTPASVDSIPSSNGQEDHVSMGANAATKAYTVLQNCWTIMGIEFMTCMQGFNLDSVKETSPRLTEVVNAYRKEIGSHTEDRYLSAEIAAATALLRKLAYL